MDLLGRLFGTRQATLEGKFSNPAFDQNQGRTDARRRIPSVTCLSVRAAYPSSRPALLGGVEKHGPTE
jgi:hypothetical protein